MLSLCGIPQVARATTTIRSEWCARFSASVMATTQPISFTAQSCRSRPVDLLSRGARRDTANAKRSRPAPIVVLAVHDPGLRFVKRQSAFCKSTPDRLQHRLGLFLALAVDTAM